MYKKSAPKLSRSSDVLSLGPSQRCQKRFSSDNAPKLMKNAPKLLKNAPKLAKNTSNFDAKKKNEIRKPKTKEIAENT